MAADHSGESSATPAESLPADETHKFDVIIAGGSTAAFAAAVASAQCGAQTALIEPTDWVGGQLTASGVAAVDEAWHTIRDPNSGRELVNVASIARDPANMTPSLLHALESLDQTGECWVSRFCFCPAVFLEQQLLPLQRRAEPRLVVYLNSVIKHVETNEERSRIHAVTIISRTPRAGIASNGYDLLPSSDVPDWYSARPSKRFQKRVLRLVANDDDQDATVFVDATEWGELLALAGAPYLQGVEDHDGATTGSDRCGQAIVFCFVERYHDRPVNEPRQRLAVSNLGYGQYRGQSDAWERIWTYRRIKGRGAPAPGDLCLQNWGYSIKLQEGGNDYPFGYLFKSRRATAAERSDWRGGVDLAVMAAAEQRALAWHEWFKSHAPPGIDGNQLALAPEVLGTTHGLAKLPYIRDTRRSIGLDGFLLRFADLTGPATLRMGTPFEDRVALGAYPADVHGLATCRLPDYVHEPGDTLPFFIPFRALTNQQFDNLIVAGKTMAQSFLANSATRLHPIEWSTGTAAGVAAAYMAQSRKTSRDAYRSIGELQRRIRAFTPLEWTIDGQRHPARREERRADDQIVE